jgi:hypothetical protein
MQECVSAYPESAGISRTDYYIISINGREAEQPAASFSGAAKR